jgi:hypothetical protein
MKKQFVQKAQKNNGPVRLLQKAESFFPSAKEVKKT